jgi:hypothetical protein
MMDTTMSSMASNVVATLHSSDAHRCVKIIREPDGKFGFQEYRRDPEDSGGWTLVRQNPRGTFASQAQAAAAAEDDVAWLHDQRSTTP